MSTESTELALANTATELSGVTSIPEVRRIHSVAEALRLMCKKAGKGLAVQNRAAELKLIAERKLGQFLANVQLAQGRRNDLVSSRNQVDDNRPTLSDLGISKSDSSRWQTIAAVPQEDFDRFITETKQADKELTTAAMLRFAKSLQRTVIDVPCHQVDQAPARIYSSLHEAAPSIPQFSCIYVNSPAIVACNDHETPDAERSQIDAFDALAKLPVEKVSSPNAHLHLWVEDEQVADAIWLINQWGFTFVGCFVWVKPGIGYGQYWRKSHQLLFTAVRGDLAFKNHALRSWQEFPLPIDGGKPEGVRQLIEAASPGPYLELFGNSPVPGWHVVRQPNQSADCNEDATNSTVEIVAIGSDSLRG